MVEERRQPARIAVVGGGITGLTAAWELRKLWGDRAVVTVMEGSPRLGGKLSLVEVDGLTLDGGAESMLARRPEAVDLAREVGLGDDLVHPATAGAAVWSHGALRPLPAGQVMGVPGDLRALASSGVLSRAELARVPLDAWRPRTSLSGDVSVGSYVGQRLGRAVVDRLVEPLLGGVYAGSADRLSFRATIPHLAAAAEKERSLLAATRGVVERGRGATGPVFAGIRGGIGRLPGAVAAASGAEVRTGATVRAIRQLPDGGWELTCGSAAAPELLLADAVVLTTPAAPTARLLEPLAPDVAEDLRHVEYASMALVAFVLGPGADLPPGTGFLVPAVEGRFIKAATFASAKWGWLGEAAGERTVVRVSVGRHGDEADLQHDDAELTRRALADLGQLVPLRAPVLDSAVIRWGGGLPQYDVGHLARVARIREGLRDRPTLAVAGAAYDGVGIPTCIASGRAAAQAVTDGLRASTSGDAGQWAS